MYFVLEGFVFRVGIRVERRWVVYLIGKEIFFVKMLVDIREGKY